MLYMDMKRIVSVIIGFSLGAVLMYIIRRKEIEHGPDSNQIRREIYQHKGKCYKFVPQPYICPI
jgi:hypothetical protein